MCDGLYGRNVMRPLWDLCRGAAILLGTHHVASLQNAHRALPSSPDFRYAFLHKAEGFVEIGTFYCLKRHKITA